MKVYLSPSIDKVVRGSGIGAVLWAQAQHLPRYGIEFVDDWEQADVTVGHTVLTGIPRADVIHSHGLFWSGDPESGKYNEGTNTTNRILIDEMARARYVTVPSPWVAKVYKRDLHISPVVIGHGIDCAEWEPGENQGYVLWGKARKGDVCDPNPPYHMALRGVPVVSTFAPDEVDPPASMKVMGHLTHPAMQDAIRHADVYLATTKETFGIQTLEAMMCAVPVLGYRWGGTADLVEHQVTGYLVEPHDEDGLFAGLTWLREHRAEIGANCREKASHYDWSQVIEKYATLFQRVIDERAQEPTGVSIVITNHNYARFVGECIDSVLVQTHPADEVIVVDDGSTDDSLKVLEPYRDRVRVIAKENGGVASARNAGAQAATQPYLTFLDADDRLDPEFISTLLPRLQGDRGLGIAYSRMGFIPPILGDPVVPSPWFDVFSFLKQSEPTVPPPGLIPSACMFRRDMWQRAGGVKQDYAPGEDSEFWMRGLSLGYRAECVDMRLLFHYRNHRDGAHIRLKYGPTDTWHPWMRDHQYPVAAPTGLPVLVRSYSAPTVSVILVHPDIRQDWVNTLDKLHGQDFRNWECLVVPKGPLPPAYVWCDPCKSVVEALDRAIAPHVLVVDSRYEWTPTTLTMLLGANALTGGRLIAGEGLVFTPVENARRMVRQIGELMGCKCRADPATTAMRERLAQDVVAIPVNLPSEAKQTLLNQRRQQELHEAAAAVVAPGTTRMEYQGSQQGAIPFSTRSGNVYRGAGVGKHRFADVANGDVSEMLQKGWRVVKAGQQDQPTRVFRYLGNGTMNVIGSAGTVLGTVGQQPGNKFLRIPESEVGHVRIAYGEVLEEVGNGVTPPPVAPQRGVMVPA